MGKNSWNGREANFAFLNLGEENFVEAGFALGIDSIADSRSFVAFDADHDGDQDLLVKFNIPDTGISCGDPDATLDGMTFGGSPVSGTDSLNTINCGGGGGCHP